MLKRDLIMVQIEELGKVIAQIIGLRNNDAANKTPNLVQVVYSTLDISTEYLMATPPADIHTHLNKDDNCGLQRMEIATKTLIEESLIYPIKRQEMILRAKELLDYIQKHDNTFSLERVALIDKAETILAEGER